MFLVTFRSLIRRSIPVRKSHTIRDGILNILNKYASETNSSDVDRIYEECKVKFNRKFNDMELESLSGGVYANNFVNFEKIDVVGFDLDYTLVTYNVELQKLIYNLAKELLILSYGFPDDLRSMSFDKDFAIRGLCVDKKKGVLCKLSHLQRIGHKYVFKGRKALNTAEIDDMYGEFRHISSEELASDMKPLNDMFAMAEACLVADAVHVLDQKKKAYGWEVYDMNAVVDDVLSAIREVHMSGAMHNSVLADPERFIIKTPALYDLLLRYHNSGKKLFLCTNSGVKYAIKALSVALQRDSSDWRKLFNVIICSANKPTFFEGKKPFRRWIETSNSPSAIPVGAVLEHGDKAIYVNGSVRALRHATGWESRRVLYIGDNLFADLVEAQKFHGWQTACVIQELGKEISVQNTEKFQILYNFRTTTRWLINELQAEVENRVGFSGDAKLYAGTKERSTQATDLDSLSAESDASTTAQVYIFTEEEKAEEQSIASTDMQEYNAENQSRKVIAQLEESLSRINAMMSQCFNVNFGSSFRTDGSPTMFAFQVRRYVDLYMENVGNLLNYSPYHRFFPAHGTHMAHDFRHHDSTELEKKDEAEQNK